jgi:hypothetical protein
MMMMMIFSSSRSDLYCDFNVFLLSMRNTASHSSVRISDTLFQSEILRRFINLKAKLYLLNHGGVEVRRR